MINNLMVQQAEKMKELRQQRDELAAALRKVTERCMSREHPFAREQGINIATDSEMADALYEARAALAKVPA
jgi:hypothetical protein